MVGKHVAVVQQCDSHPKRTGLEHTVVTVDGRNPAPVENDGKDPMIFRVSTIQAGGAGFRSHPTYRIPSQLYLTFIRET